MADPRRDGDGSATGGGTGSNRTGRNHTTRNRTTRNRTGTDSNHGDTSSDPDSNHGLTLPDPDRVPLSNQLAPFNPRSPSHTPRDLSNDAYRNQMAELEQNRRVSAEFERRTSSFRPTIGSGPATGQSVDDPTGTNRGRVGTNSDNATRTGPNRSHVGANSDDATRLPPAHHLSNGPCVNYMAEREQRRVWAERDRNALASFWPEFGPRPASGRSVGDPNASRDRVSTWLTSVSEYSVDAPAGTHGDARRTIGDPVPSQNGTSSGQNATNSGQNAAHGPGQERRCPTCNRRVTILNHEGTA
ncbi:hypothetical protein CONLIGDRAFT_645955 [Coniochaeta ligniaria NRRL 30616]|uniref:Uncharacterized protein n=1 Tax=Coniochaeta ligniaria NRRL 30616 TaxID=1408157 RepID=A0A1J7JDB2_9PEZI|nr:hypothetical protein CONLIGDRAFT_645955 [Coniochaeta ligniaria NRRL 30616]